MSFKDIMAKINGNWISRNLFWAVVYLVAVLLIANIVLLVSTQHHIKVKVPDFSGKSVAAAQQAAQRAGIKVTVVDSVFVPRMTKGAVFSQNPKAGGKVKRGRTVYLTTNALQERQVVVPNLVGCSLRQAKAELVSRGLVLGQLNYKSDIATNNVLGQMYKGKAIQPGKKVPAGSVIDLELGLNYSDCKTLVPNLRAVRYQEAVNRLHDNSLNVGRLQFDSTVKSYSDSLSAFVYKQSPEASDREVRMGSSVRLALTLDPSKLPPVDPEPAASEQPQK